MILKAIQEKEWDFGNNVLYDLCSKYPYHKKDDIIIAKVWLIGRAYAAAIERRKIKDKYNNDDFYTYKVASSIRKSELDIRLKAIIRTSLSDESIDNILLIHKYLCDLFYSLTGHHNRSLSSKYLHFHCPNLFFIYDSRAVSALSKLISTVPKEYKDHLNNKVDTQYATFFLKAYAQKLEFEEQLSQKLTPRDFDKILIKEANNNLANKKQ